MKRLRRNLSLAAILAASGFVGCSNSDSPQTQVSGLEVEQRGQQTPVEEPRKKITFYAVVRENSYFTPEAFRIAEEFLEENIGFDFEFEYVSRADLESKTLDHITTFSLVEEDSVVRAEELRAEKDKEIEEGIREFEELLERYKEIGSGGERGVERVSQALEVMKNFRTPVGRYLSAVYMNVSGEANAEDGVAYLLENPTIKMVKIDYASGKVAYSMQQTIRQAVTEALNKNPERREELERMIEKSSREIEALEIELPLLKEKLIKLASRTIVHEIGHLFGLWHTHQYINDPFEDFVRDGMPNLMSYQEVGEGKYGFALDKGQVEHIRDYLNGGRTFQEFRDSGFNLNEYFAKKAEENGWEEAENQ